MAVDLDKLHSKIEVESQFIEKIITELDKVIIGQKTLIRRLLIGLLADGHILIEGVPGLAKTLMVSSLAKIIKAKFQRIQFTPDLLPADLLGTLIFNQKEGVFTTRKGPIFANFILADEINRSPAKVQSALLEAMQEKQVTIGTESFPLDKPFLVLATQNPIEQEGTYPLPEAQVDRFMLKVVVDYPDRAEELEIMQRMGNTREIPEVKSVVTTKEILSARKVVDEVYMDEKVERYIVDLIFATRDPESVGLGELKGLISYGASPRASIFLRLAAKAHAFIMRRGYVTPEDIRAIGMDVLRHRVILTYEAEAEEMSSENLIEKIFDTVEVP